MMSPRSKLRALQVITRLTRGGAQETVLSLAEHLSRLGLEVVVASAPGGPGVEDLESLGVEFVPIPHLVREVSPRNDLRAYREIRDLIRREDFDVVHTHSSKAGFLGRLAAHRAGTPAVVHTSHGLPVSPDMGRVERSALLAAERLAARFCHKVVAVSRVTASHLLRLRLARPDQIAVAPSGIDLRRERQVSKSEARSSLGLRRDQPVLGWVGRFFEIKRPLTIVTVAKEVLTELPDAAVLLAGDGPLMEEVRSAIGNDRRIRLLGYRRDIDVVYAALDVCLLTSAYEGMPRTILEAQAAGVPVVATDVGGIREVVRDGGSGFLIPIGNDLGLATAVIGLLKDQHLHARMSEEAQRAVGDAYSVDHMAKATAGLYDQILSASLSSLR